MHPVSLLETCLKCLGVRPWRRSGHHIVAMYQCVRKAIPRLWSENWQGDG
jgi:hypothetical protein